jgi:hypothetical protein
MRTGKGKWGKRTFAVGPEGTEIIKPPPLSSLEQPD